MKKFRISSYNNKTGKIEKLVLKAENIIMARIYFKDSNPKKELIHAREL